MRTITISGNVTKDAIESAPALALDVLKHNMARQIIAQEAGVPASDAVGSDEFGNLDPRITWTEKIADDGVFVTATLVSDVL